MELGEQAKKTLVDYVALIDVRIRKYFEAEMQRKFGFNDRQRQVVTDALVHSQEYILRPTKRIRAAFVNAGFILGGQPPTSQVWDAAVGIELVHAGILMHDDFMDGDTVRRGGKTTHKFYSELFKSDHLGDTMAVNLGDAMIALGSELVARSGNTEAISQLQRGIANTAFGQSYDISLEAFRKWTEDDVLALHRAKTAIYTYENPLFVGAYLAKLPESAFEVLHDYAMDGGVAFQLQDDILGVFGTPEKTGKSADSDLKQGKCTLLVLKAFESSKHRSTVEKVWGDSEATLSDLGNAKQAIIESGSLDYSKRLAQELAGKAAQTAHKLRDLNLEPSTIDFIQGIAEYMVHREV